MKRSWIVPLVVALVVGIVAGVGTWGVRYWQSRTSQAPLGPKDFYGGVLDPPRPAPDFTLIDQHGETFRLSDHRGDLVVLFFGYTTCPDVCPGTLAQYRRVKEALGEDADRVEFVFVTVDPERDTQERLAEYIALFDPEFHGLWAEREKLEEVWRLYGVYVETVEAPDSSAGYLVNHSALSYVIDPRGNLRLAHLYGTPNDQVVHDLKLLLSERV